MIVESIIKRFHLLGEAMSQYGTRIALALLLLIVGLMLARWIDRILRRELPRFIPKKTVVTTICNIVYVVLVAVIVSLGAEEFGATLLNVVRFTSIVALTALGLIIFLRPFFPTMPFKVGNTIKNSDLLGVVEGITFLNTRLRTFDGKTFFVPNRKIINDIVVNYHFSPTRRVKINVSICHDQNLYRAKQVMETVMTEDPRVKEKPAPVVYVLDLASGVVELGGRCWVANKDYWVTRCELMEKIKHRFDAEGIQFAFPRLKVYHDRNWPRDDDSLPLDESGSRLLDPTVERKYSQEEHQS
jgi:small conductance mechanosensitive channel